MFHFLHCVLCFAPCHLIRFIINIAKNMIKSEGTWGVGLATRRCNLSKIPLGDDVDSWVVRQDGYMFHNGEQKGKLPDIPQEGDILVSYVKIYPLTV